MTHLPLPISILPSDIKPQHKHDATIWPVVVPYKAVVFIQVFIAIWMSTFF